MSIRVTNAISIVEERPFFLNIIHCKGIIGHLCKKKVCSKRKRRLSPSGNYLNYCWFTNPSVVRL